MISRRHNNKHFVWNKFSAREQWPSSYDAGIPIQRFPVRIHASPLQSWISCSSFRGGWIPVFYSGLRDKSNLPPHSGGSSWGRWMLPIYKRCPSCCIKFFGGKIFYLIDSINPCRNTASFKRRCDVLQHLTTSYRRWNNIKCLEGSILFGMNCLIMLRMNWLMIIFRLIFLRKLSTFFLIRKKSTISVFSDWKVIEKSEFKAKYSVWTPYNKSTILPYLRVDLTSAAIGISHK